MLFAADRGERPGTCEDRASIWRWSLLRGTRCEVALSHLITWGVGDPRLLCS